MEPLHIEMSKSTPEVTLDKSKGIFLIIGKSLPEDAIGFYQPAINWLGEYLKDPNPSTELTFEMHYFNTASSKIIYDIICLLKEPLKNGKDVKVLWRYLDDDEDTLEAGEDYAELSKVPFSFRSIVG